MPDFIPTPEQDAIIAAALQTNDNLCVVARAGAAKTSTLILVAEALSAVDILCLAFNKAIATEMTERLPDNCEAKTLHSLGFAAWGKYTRGEMTLKSSKVYTLLKARIETLGGEDKKEAYGQMRETMEFISAAKSSGYLPAKFTGAAKSLVDDADFFSTLPMEPSGLQQELVKSVLGDSLKQGREGVLDFDDMIYLPALHAVTWPSPPLTLIDEAQDLSPINHHILKKLVRNRRIIAVGDPCQAIYGFRGALTDSMDQLQKKFSMRRLHLTISFRCARAVTENAQWRAPDMRAPDWAVDGEVTRPLTWDATSIAEGDAIICRNNAPLFSLGIKLIQHGLLPEIAGRDIGASIRKVMGKLGKPSMLSISALDAVRQWQEVNLKRARDGAKGAIHDKAACMVIFLQQTKTLGDAIAYLDHLLTREGRIHLMTGHKAKGREFDTVWFLDQHFCRIKHEQDANIKYVIETRAKHSLHYVTSETLEFADE